jgi:large subunit ribosomal protein L9
MEIILTQGVDGLGEAGDVVSVKRGYAANYLIPTGRAVHGTSRNQARLVHERKVVEASLAKQRADADGVAKRLGGLSVTITRLVGEGDKIFGSVTGQDIVDALAAEGVKIERRQVQIESPLRALGVYGVPIKLHREVVAQLKVWVVAD